MRVLFLHGMWHPPSIYQEELMAPLWSKMEDAGFTISACQSPRNHIVGQAIRELHPELRQHVHPEWYTSTYDENGQTTHLEGIADTLNFIQNHIHQEAPFDVIMGHSQGAQLCSILTLLAESDPSFLPKGKHWKLVVLMNSPNSFDRVDILQNLVHDHKKIQQTRSIHVFGGPKDQAWEGQQQMKRVHFEDANSYIVRHNEGHWPPSDEDVCDELIKRMLEILKM